MPMVAVKAGSSNLAAGHVNAAHKVIGIVLLLVLIGIVLLI